METAISRVFFVLEGWQIQNFQLKQVPYNKLLTNLACLSRTVYIGPRSFVYVRSVRTATTSAKMI